jgi:hypothetical protein
MHFKLSFNDPIFYINEDKQLVTCVLSVYPQLLGNEKISRVCEAIAHYYLSDADYEKFYHCFTVTAYARLHPADKFDVEAGKKVARAKAESKAYRYYANLIDRTIGGQFADDLELVTEEFFDKAYSVITHNNKYLDKF